MYSTKTLLQAATLAILAATGAGIGAASAQPYENRFERRYDDRLDRRDTYESRRYLDDRFAPQVSHRRIAHTLRLHGLRIAGEPRSFHGRTMVRAQDRFGRLVIVHLDRRGELVRVNRL